MYNNNNFIVNERLYIIPQDEETRLAILNIDRKTKEDLRNIYKIWTEHDWQNNTTTNVLVETLIKSLAHEIVNSQKSLPLNFFDLFTASVTVKRNEDAEKEGNINVSFNPGKEAKRIIETYDSNIQEDDSVRPRLELLLYPDPNTGKFVQNEYFDSQKEVERLWRIEKATRLELSEKYTINIPDKSASTITIAYVFIKNIFRYLIEKMKLTNKQSASVNFNDNIEFHALMKNNEILLTMRPGMNAKLLIKSDETTEAEELED